MDKRFQIVTDSSCDLPQAMADELDLAVLPLHVHIGEETYANYLDGREIGFHDFLTASPPGRRPRPAP
ncbi:MAG: DegV family protein [Oscillospiraceae bacterium]